MIKSFRDKNSSRLWEGKRVAQFQSFHLQALRRLDILNAAIRLEDLLLNPGNRFEALGGDRQGQFSIRINQKWRICFEWDDQDAINVEITDYH